MTLFEYLAIAFSIAFSLTAARIVSGLPYAARPDRRDPAHLANCCSMLITTVGVFWLSWAYRNVDWTFARFVLVLANPGLLYATACTLIPDDAAEVRSWGDHFREVRRRYFLLLACWIVVAFVMTTWLLGLPWTHPARALQALTLAIAIGGVASRSDRHHVLIALALLLGSVISFAILLVPQ